MVWRPDYIELKDYDSNITNYFIKKINNLNEIKKNKSLINIKKIIPNFTKFRFAKNFAKIINY